MSEEQAEELIGQSATLWAESLVHLIEAEFEIMTKADAARLRQDAATAPDGTRIITLYDRADHQRKEPLLVLTVGKTDDVVIDRAMLQRIGA